MNYFKAAEQLLAALPELERAVENLKHREDRIVNSGAPKMPAAIDYAKPFADVTSINDTLSEMLALTEVQRKPAQNRIANRRDKTHTGADGS